MKKLILILAITSIGSFAQAQNVNIKTVPVAVTSKFSSLYPTSKAEQWKKEKGGYETKFVQNKVKTCVVIDSVGNVVKTTTDIAVSELPRSANDYVAKNYANQKIVEASKTTEADGTVKYETKVKEMQLCFDADGNFVKSEKCKRKTS